MSRLGGVAMEHFEAARDAAREELLSCGSVCAGSGTMEAEPVRIEVHTDYGPLEQDKDTNQDFVLAWMGRRSDERGERWAIAMADGVSSAYHAEVAAELACWSGMAQLLSSPDTGAERARAAVNAAGEAIGRLGDLIESEAETYLPSGEFASTWRFTLQEGLLLQTTLTLAWFEKDRLQVAMIGDGGALLELGEPGRERTEVLGEVDDATSRVHAIGPRNRTIEKLDVWKQWQMDGAFRLAVFTDGIGRGLLPDACRLIAELKRLGADESINRAERLIRCWVETEPAEFEDNLSLAMVTRA